MLVNYLDGHETHVNPNYIIKTWRTKNSLVDGGYNYRLKMFGDKQLRTENSLATLIDRDSYVRIVTWLEAQ